MAQTLLASVNAVLKRKSIVSGDAGALTSLTESARQVSIDLAVQVINEGISELYTTAEIAQPNEQAESTIVLVLGTRAYTLATDLVQLRWPMIDKTNTQWLREYPGGYNAMLTGDPEQDDTGQPHFAAIRATDGKLYLDRAPLAADVGKIYTYQYDKSLWMTTATDIVPFNDDVFNAMVPVWAELFGRDRQGAFDPQLFRLSVGRASRLLTQKQMRSHYNPR